MRRSDVMRRPSVFAVTIRPVQHVLDIDLDFFVDPVIHWPPQNERPSGDDHDVWSIDDALTFLRTRCGVTGRLPGFLTENHAELFPMWRRAIEAHVLTPPFHVTHVDAHADLRLGDAGYMYLLTNLVFRPVEERQHPAVGHSGLNDGNFLSFAIACRWLAELEYVYTGEGGDELSCVMEGFDPRGDHIELAGMTRDQIERLWCHVVGDPIPVAHREPKVPYRSARWDTFQAVEPYDFICLTRSPPYAPPTADPIYDAIRDALMDPITQFASPTDEKIIGWSNSQRGGPPHRSRHW
jgi:hypothetical protein